MDRTELAWAAGFFDAEGWAAAVKNRTRTQPHAQINQTDPIGIPEVLTRFRAAVGAGRIRGPKQKEHRVDLYHWVASSRGDVTCAFGLLAPWLGAVKTAQFVDAVGPVALLQREEQSSADEDRAWAAGLFDGDGSTYFAKHKTHPGYVRAEMAVTQSSRTGVPEVLIRFRDLVGAGGISGPFGGNEVWEPVYRWKAHKLWEIDAIADMLWPWLGSVKRLQASTVIASVAAQAPLPRGNPAWGNRKTHCINGHEYDTARVRPYRARSVGGSARRASQQCLACLREFARRKYAEKKTRRFR